MGVNARLVNLKLRLLGAIRGYEKVQFEHLVSTGTIVRGAGSYGYPIVRTFIHENPRLIIGNYTSIALGATFLLGGEHPLDRVTTHPLRIHFSQDGAGKDGFPSPTADTRIGSDVWVGANATILGGRTVGHGAVVAAGALVTTDVEPFSVVGGCPARPLKSRHTEAQRLALLEIAWWDWAPNQIERATPYLASREIDEFIMRARDGYFGT